MVKDNATNLIREGKTNDGSIHDKDNTYNWNDARVVFIKELNALKSGGFADWRLPTIKEPFTIFPGYSLGFGESLLVYVTAVRST